MKKSRRILILCLVLALMLGIGLTVYAVEVKVNPRFEALYEIAGEEEMRRLEIIANAPEGADPEDYNFGENFGRFFGEDGKLTEEAIALADARIAQNAAK